MTTSRTKGSVARRVGWPCFLLASWFLSSARLTRSLSKPSADGSVVRTEKIILQRGSVRVAMTFRQTTSTRPNLQSPRSTRLVVRDKATGLLVENPSLSQQRDLLNELSRTQSERE